MKKNLVIALLLGAGLLLSSLRRGASLCLRRVRYDEEDYLHRDREEDRLDEPSHLHPC